MKMFLISLILLFSKKPARDTISNCFRMCVFEIEGCLNDERRPKTNLVIVVVQRAITMVAAIVACLHFAATLYRHNNEWVTGRRPRMFQQDNSLESTTMFHRNLEHCKPNQIQICFDS